MSRKKKTLRRNTFLQLKRSRAGLGLFAGVSIKKGEFVIEYTGDVISDKEADERGGKYLFDINTRWTIDAKDRKHLARYINHSCRPNCQPEIEHKKINIYAKRNIVAGEELTYNYGKEYFDEFIKPDGCKCEACLLYS